MNNIKVYGSDIAVQRAESVQSRVWNMAQVTPGIILIAGNNGDQGLSRAEIAFISNRAF